MQIVTSLQTFVSALKILEIPRPWLWLVQAIAISLLGVSPGQIVRAQGSGDVYRDQIAPWIRTHCLECHNEDKRESGIRLDNLDDAFPEDTLRLWEVIYDQVSSGEMPPEEGVKPSEPGRKQFIDWVRISLDKAKSRPTPRNGLMRRLTVSQYDRTLKELLGIERNLTETLPPDAISKEGFTNQASTLAMNPLQLESYFRIAEEALETALVDEKLPPKIEYFRMDLGRSIHPSPSKEVLILGANNHLIANQDFIVTEPPLEKAFPFEPFRMQRKFRFIEGYQGNDTVRGWRDFEGIEHAVFACMRGNEGYPKGKAYEVFTDGLALKPAIPSPEIFGESSTYGPQANFKISLRELPERGLFQVRVTASKADDLLLVDAKTQAWTSDTPAAIVIPWNQPTNTQTDSIDVKEDGIYLVQLHQRQPEQIVADPDSSNLQRELIGHWPMDPESKEQALDSGPMLVGKASWAETPFGSGLQLVGEPSAFAEPIDRRFDVGAGDFSISAWIYPKKLTQGGILSVGGYGYTHGWLFDMPDQQGILRIETADSDRKHNGTVQSAPGIIAKDTWQHVCAVVRRETGGATELFVNGYRVASGKIGGADLTNPNARLIIGRIENAQGFHGLIDEVRLYKRALSEGDIQALLQPGKGLTKPPAIADNKLNVTLQLRKNADGAAAPVQLSAPWTAPSFCLARLSQGPWELGVSLDNPNLLDRIEIHRIDGRNVDLQDAFLKFESSNPKLGVHLGLRRDCGSTLTQVGQSKEIVSNRPTVLTFQGDIRNYPAPDVEPDNVNYLAGIREIGVRHEFTDGRETPRLIVHRIEFEGPYYEVWPPDSHRKIFKDRLQGETDRAYGIRMIERFAASAFRRPLSDREKSELADVLGSEISATSDLHLSIKETLLVILTSPQFLYLNEKSQTPEDEPIDDWEMASKLSYFLWNGPPDDELLSLASQGRLRQDLDRQVERMIQDPKSELFSERFVSEWLSLDKFDVVEVDAKRFPHLTRDVRKHLRNEPIKFFRHNLLENKPVMDLIQSDYIVANEVVANYYGLAERTQSGFEFAPIQHNSDLLGGILTQAAPLSGLSDGREGNPVKRGAWFARKIISEPPEDPPPNVPKLEDLTQLSLREKLQRHRDVRGCAQCHSGIDPWGLPFESFDASGLSRKDPVDSATQLADGKQIANFQEFRRYLANERRDQVAFSLAKHLATYACGRSLTYNETRWIREHLSELKPDGYKITDMVRWIIHSDLFDKK